MPLHVREWDFLFIGMKSIDEYFRLCTNITDMCIYFNFLIKGKTLLENHTIHCLIWQQHKGVITSIKIRQYCKTRKGKVTLL